VLVVKNGGLPTTAWPGARSPGTYSANQLAEGVNLATNFHQRSPPVRQVDKAVAANGI